MLSPPLAFLQFTFGPWWCGCHSLPCLVLSVSLGFLHCPWGFANAVTFLNLWSKLPQDDEPVAPVAHVFLQPPSTTPLWRALLPYCITVFTLQSGLMLLLTGHPCPLPRFFPPASCCSSCVIHLSTARQKAAQVFSLFAAADSRGLFPHLNGTHAVPSKGVWPAFSGFLFPRPYGSCQAGIKPALGSHFSGVILTLPAKPHPHIEPLPLLMPPAFPVPLQSPSSFRLMGLLVLQTTETRRQKTHTFSKATPQSQCALDGLPATFHGAHQTLLTPISGDCCRAIAPRTSEWR